MYEKLIERLREYPDREETAGGYVEIDWQDLLDAADAIESLNTQLAALQAEAAEKDKEIERLSEQLEADSQLQSGLSNANALCSMYKAALSRVEAERDAARQDCDIAEENHHKAVIERDAAVKDMKLMADKAREEHGDSVPCFACRFDFDMSIMPSGDFANECPGFDKEDCFKWRGAQGEVWAWEG